MSVCDSDDNGDTCICEASDVEHIVQCHYNTDDVGYNESMMEADSLRVQCILEDMSNFLEQGLEDEVWLEKAVDSSMDCLWPKAVDNLMLEKWAFQEDDDDHNEETGGFGNHNILFCGHKWKGDEDWFHDDVGDKLVCDCKQSMVRLLKLL